MSTFRELTQWAAGSDGVRRAVLPESWMQGRGAFGGIISAAGLEAVLGDVGGAGPVRSVQTQFLGPVRPGVEARCRVEVLRRGRSLVVAEARIEQDGALAAVCTVTLGRSRPSGLAVPTEASPGGTPGEGIPVPYTPGITPQFLQHLELRWTDGQPPFTGGDQAVAGGWCRHGTDADGLGALLGLLDAWPAPVLSLATRPFPASTVHWTAHVVGSLPAPGGWMRFLAVPVSCGDGYVTTRGHLWDEEGRLVAWMEQLVAVFDIPRT